jgi:hypothetical protein
MAVGQARDDRFKEKRREQLRKGKPDRTIKSENSAKH